MVLKTKLKEAILESVQSGIQAPPEIVQMLLVLGKPKGLTKIQYYLVELMRN